VFGAARTRQGKKVTARQLVPPSNPNTAGQQTQRGKFSEAVAITRLVGASIYQSYFNRAIGQLPGFQSFESIMLNSLSSTFVLSAPPAINLGSLHVPSTLTLVRPGTTGHITVQWSTELGLNGLATDSIYIVAIASDPAASPLERVVNVDTSAVRSDGGSGIELAGYDADVAVMCMIFAVGNGSTAGLVSPTSSGLGNTGF
jgi:hypothetical protein